MPPETKAGAVHEGRDVTTIGDRLRVGHMPPWFELDAARAGKEKPSKIGIESLGSKFILLSVPSLDTPVCDEEVKRFRELRREIMDYQMCVASMDLPFAQWRWLDANGLLLPHYRGEDGVLDAKIPLISAGSDHRTGAFGQAYGVLMKEPRQLMRAVFVVKGGYCSHVEYIHDSDKQVDFDAAIAAAKR